MRFWIGWVLSALASAIICTSAPGGLALAQPLPATIDACRNLSDADVRAKINELTATSLRAELGAIDYADLVNKHWAKSLLDARIDKEIDEAIAAIKSDSSWIDRAYSTVSQSEAARYATAVADKAFNSTGFKSAIEDLATGVATDAGGKVVSATNRVSNPIVTCVQTALQSRYGGAIAQVFAAESQRQLEASGEAGAIKLEASDLALANINSISGIVLIVTRRIIARVVASVGRRIASAVATRIVSSIALVVGVFLVAKDIYEAGEGVFPIIAERMKAEETKDLIKEEVIKSLKGDIEQHVDTIAQETGERIFAVWLDFKQKYHRLLGYADKDAAFADFLKDRRFDQLDKLGQLVDMIVAFEGEGGIQKRLGDGSLNFALLELPDEGLLIARETKSLEVGLKWAQLAGKDVKKVAELGLYRWLAPEALTKDQLRKILSLNDRALTEKLAGLDEQARGVILGLSASEVELLTRRLSKDELAALALLEQRLEPAVGRRLLREALKDSRIMRELAGPLARDGLLASRDQGAALDMLTRDGLFWGYTTILSDYERVRDGQVSYKVFWVRYWLASLGLLLAALIVLAWLRRMIFGAPARR